MTNILATFKEPANIAVFGASGGIGEAFVRHLQDNSMAATIHAFSRSEFAATGGRVRSLSFSLDDEDSIATAAASATKDGPLDLVIVASGILHGKGLLPEKSMRELDPVAMSEVLRVNTIGPAIIAKHVLPLMRPGHKSVFAALSARVGSIGDNRLGGWASYRMSKAALNMLVRTLAIEQSRRRPESIVVALHPGTVNTRLSQPFTSRVPESRLFTPAVSANHLLNVIDKLTTDDTGGFFAWDASKIEF